MCIYIYIYIYIYICILQSSQTRVRNNSVRTSKLFKLWIFKSSWFFFMKSTILVFLKVYIYICQKIIHIQWIDMPYHQLIFLTSIFSKLSKIFSTDNDKRSKWVENNQKLNDYKNILICLITFVHLPLFRYILVL